MSSRCAVCEHQQHVARPRATYTYKWGVILFWVNFLHRVTYHMQRVVFAAVLADAEMVERALDIDVHAMCAAAVQAAAAPRGGRRAAGAGG